MLNVYREPSPREPDVAAALEPRQQALIEACNDDLFEPVVSRVNDNNDDGFLSPRTTAAVCGALLLTTAAVYFLGD